MCFFNMLLMINLKNRSLSKQISIYPVGHGNGELAEGGHGSGPLVGKECLTVVNTFHKT